MLLSKCLRPSVTAGPSVVVVWLLQFYSNKYRFVLWKLQSVVSIFKLAAVPMIPMKFEASD